MCGDGEGYSADFSGFDVWYRVLPKISASTASITAPRVGWYVLVANYRGNQVEGLVSGEEHGQLLESCMIQAYKGVVSIRFSSTKKCAAATAMGQVLPTNWLLQTNWTHRALQTARSCFISILCCRLCCRLCCPRGPKKDVRLGRWRRRGLNVSDARDKVTAPTRARSFSYSSTTFGEKGHFLQASRHQEKMLIFLLLRLYGCCALGGANSFLSPCKTISWSNLPHPTHSAATT